jgi:HPt (histidine-containing phosphotransfer) domain-containing protein
MDVLHEITAGSQEILQEIVGEYIGMAADVLSTLGGAVGGSDAHQIAQLSHTLKGSSGMIGAVGVMRACEVLEDAALAGDMLAAGAAFAELTERHASTVKKLRALQEGVAA